VQRSHRKVQPLARKQIKSGSRLLILVLELRRVVTIREKVLELLFLEKRPSNAVEYTDRLLARDLEQEVVLGIDVKRRDRPRRGYENESFAFEHPVARRRAQRFRDVEASVQKLGILGDLLHVLQHHPRLAVLDASKRIFL